MNTTQLNCLLVLLSAISICGCDAGKKGEAQRKAALQQVATFSNEIEVLKDQNTALAKMLEESESKLAVRTSNLEQTNKRLQASLTANAELETRLSETNTRLMKVGELADQIQASFNTNTATLEKQIQSLGAMIPPAAAAQHANQDPTAEQTAENSDDQGEH